MLAAARRPGLESLRAWATVLVVMLHAGVPFTVAPMPGLAWPVDHTIVSPIVDALFWAIEGAIMPLFFLLSGFVAAQSLAARPEQFLASRWRRLGWPLLVGCAILLPVDFYVWLTGWALDGKLPWKKLLSLRIGKYEENLLGMSHLWYLEYLLIFCVVLWAGDRWLRYQVKAAAGIGSLSKNRECHSWLWLRCIPNIPVLFALTAAVLWYAPEVVVGFQHSFFPQHAKCIYSALFFGAGVAEFHRPMQFRLDRWWAYAGCAVLHLGLLPLIHRQALRPLVGCEKLVLVIGMTTYAVVVTHALWQRAWNSRRATPRAVAYLSQASFWVYLVHHPTVVIWQIALRPLAWPAGIQFTLCTLGTLAVSLVSYEWFVRRTALGAFLDGRRPERKLEPAIQVPVRRAA
jgi:peptidoglycan/LPS O-acetylase OafA/YrhL